jgi:hypothetical protein
MVSRQRLRKHVGGFAKELRRASKRQVIKAPDLARRIGRSLATVRHYYEGYMLPSFAIAELMSEILDAPTLLELVKVARTKQCHNCQRDFVDVSPTSTRHYCSDLCEVIYKKRHKGESSRYRAFELKRELVVTNQALKAHQDGILATCMECEPEGLCRTPRCPLQVHTLSPFQVDPRFKEKSA